MGFPVHVHGQLVRLYPHPQVLEVFHRTVLLVEEARSQKLAAKSSLQNSSPASASLFPPAPVRTMRRRFRMTTAAAPATPQFRRCGWPRRLSKASGSFVRVEATRFPRIEM